MKRWSKLQKAIELLFVTEPKVRIQCRSYRMGSQRGSTNLPRYWVTLDKETIWDYPKDFKSAADSGYPYLTDISTFSNLIRQYIDTPLDQLLISSSEQDTWGLTDILRAADRRLGRERLLEWGEALPPLVHLSQDRSTATNVGKRHGSPVVLEVHSGQMHFNGFKFHLSENGVWLTDHVPKKYIDGL